VRIAFPVFDDSADDEYQRIHRKMKTAAEDAGGGVVKEAFVDMG